MAIPRICKNCGKKFIPTGKYCKDCDDCRFMHWSKRKSNINSKTNKKLKDGI